MREVWSSSEIWVYECLCCFTTWREEFEARHVVGGHSGEGVVYVHDGHLCVTPWMDHPCPKCKSNNVKAFSAPGGHPAVPPSRRDNDLDVVFRLRRLHAW